MRQHNRLTQCLVFAGLLTLAFIQPLAALMAYASGKDLHSHILLIPFVSAYLISLQFKCLPTTYRASPAWATLCAAVGLAALGAAWHFGKGAPSVSWNDHLALLAFAYVCLLAAGGFFFLGRTWMAAAAFPVAFLIFIVPLPDGVAHALETASKMASAEAASWFFSLAGVPYLRDGQVFQLPGITLEVAQECSGIRSSWVLFITSLVASHLFLASPWRRLLLVALIIPLGVLRNGFRILVIGWLCVEKGPHMIDSYIHHRGGPIFFALSMIPLFGLLWWLRRGETKRSPKVVPALVPLESNESTGANLPG